MTTCLQLPYTANTNLYEGEKNEVRTGRRSRVLYDRSCVVIRCVRSPADSPWRAGSRKHRTLPRPRDHRLAAAGDAERERVYCVKILVEDRDKRGRSGSILRGNTGVSGPLRGGYEYGPIQQSVWRSARTGTPPMDAARPTATAAIQTILGESYGENVKEEVAILQDCENYQCNLGMGDMATNTPSHQNTCEQDEDQAE
jgi:hypothetical protein